MLHPSGYSKEKPNLEYVSVAVGVGVGVGVGSGIGSGLGVGVGVGVGVGSTTGGVGVGVVGEGAQALTKRKTANAIDKIITPSCFCLVIPFFTLIPP